MRFTATPTRLQQLTPVVWLDYLSVESIGEPLVECCSPRVSSTSVEFRLELLCAEIIKLLNAKYRSFKWGCKMDSDANVHALAVFSNKRVGDHCQATLWYDFSRLMKPKVDKAITLTLNWFKIQHLKKFHPSMECDCYVHFDIVLSSYLWRWSGVRFTAVCLNSNQEKWSEQNRCMNLCHVFLQHINWTHTQRVIIHTDLIMCWMNSVPVWLWYRQRYLFGEYATPL